MENKPEYGKVYALTGGSGQPSIASGNTWAESRVETKKCEACEREVIFHDICWDCVRARHRAALSHRCTCPKALKFPKEIKQAGEVRIKCGRCLGAIKTK